MRERARECAPSRSCTGSWPAAGAAAAAARPCRSAWFALHAAAMLLLHTTTPSDMHCTWVLRRHTFRGDEVLGLVALLPHHAHVVSRGAAWTDASTSSHICLSGHAQAHILFTLCWRGRRAHIKDDERVAVAAAQPLHDLLQPRAGHQRAGARQQLLGHGGQARQLHLLLLLKGVAARRTCGAIPFLMQPPTSSRLQGCRFAAWINKVPGLRLFTEHTLHLVMPTWCCPCKLLFGLSFHKSS